MAKQLYLQHLAQLLRAEYQSASRSASKTPSVSRIEGYMEAGMLLGQVSRDDLTRLIDEVHQEVFGTPFNEKRPVEILSEDELDVPTWLRWRHQSRH